MKENEIKSKLKVAISVFLNLHQTLLEIDVNERSITHKFAECLAPLFPGWDVDCEYNRVGSDPKRLYSDLVSIKPEKVESDDTEGTTIYPDIIIHHRNESELGNNLLVIEAKKNPSDSDRKKDIDKIRAIKKELKYKYGVFLEVSTKKRSINYKFE